MSTPQSLPIPGYRIPREGDEPPINVVPYAYRALITHVYDADTLTVDIDLGFNIWLHGERIRLAGINSNEIRRSSAKGIGDDHVEIGYDARDILLDWLGVPPELIPDRKAQYQELAVPVEVIIQTIKDTSGKFGRILGIINKDGNNLNQWMARAGYAEVDWYDGKTRPRDEAITPRGGS